MMVRADNLTKKYGKRCIFSEFSYEFPSNGLVAIVGESGSGKSTLLNMISGLDFDYEGKLKVIDKNLKDFKEDELSDFRIKNIGYVFQNFNLISTDTSFNNVFLPIDTISNAKNNIKKQRTIDCLKLVGLEKFKKVRVNKLSGGEKQRVAVARAIVNDPPIILCDEPTGALDEKNSEEIFTLLSRISTQKLVIVATHDLESIQSVADVILEIKEEKICAKTLNNAKQIESPLLIGPGIKRKKSHVSVFFKFLHSLQKMRAKKYRTLIVNLMLSLSLTGVGLSLIISSSVSEKVNSAFKEILNGNQIVMSLKNENENTFTNSYSTSYEKIEKIYGKYKYLFDGIGVNYLVNFEDFFKDKNEFWIPKSNKNIFISTLSARNINDFKWLDDEQIIFPQNVELLDDDQVVLGLSYEDMVNLCFQLQIQRNYTSLGHYIYEKGVEIVAKFANEYWQYDDEQIFSVVGICESNKTCFYHTNQLWNEIVFEKMMRLPSDDDDVHEFPWEMFKIYYFKTISDPGIFLDASLYDDELYDFVFERTNYSYNPTMCEYNAVCDEKRIYTYSVDKNAISPAILEQFKEKLPTLNNYYFTSDFGYASYASNLFSGFSKNVFISPEQTSIDNAIDADTQINNTENLSIKLPDDVIQGNYLNSLGNGLRFSSKLDNILYGRKPTNLNEIVISKGLAKQFDNDGLCMGKYLYFAGENAEYQDNNGNVSKEYCSTKLLVVGIVDENKNYIYHNHDWTISFFRDKLGVSNFLLIPRSIIFEFDNETDAANAFQIFKECSYDYKYTNPIDDLNTNVNSTLEYANTILVAFSVLSTIISILLLGTVLMLSIIEGKDEIKLFKYLGISNKDINSIFTFYGVTQGLIAFVISAFELIVVDVFISYFLGDYLNIGFKFSINSLPILVIFVLSIVIPFLTSKIMIFIMNRKSKT